MRGPKNSHFDLSPEFIRSTFHYEPETGQLLWKQQLARRAPAGNVAGTTADKGRIKIGIKNRDYMAHRIIWVWMTGEWPLYEVDHINGNQSDNRWKNLRQATPSENHRNRGPQKNNTSGYKGVTFVAKRNCFIAGIKLNGYRHNLGSFKTAEEAHAAYCEAAKKLHGDFAKSK